jgi:hypothetical protein
MHFEGIPTPGSAEWVPHLKHCKTLWDTPFLKQTHQTLIDDPEDSEDKMILKSASFFLLTANYERVTRPVTCPSIPNAAKLGFWSLLLSLAIFAFLPYQLVPIVLGTGIPIVLTAHTTILLLPPPSRVLARWARPRHAFCPVTKYDAFPASSSSALSSSSSFSSSRVSVCRIMYPPTTTFCTTGR